MELSLRSLNHCLANLPHSLASILQKSEALPILKLALENNKVAFVGCSGGLSSRETTVEIDPRFAQALRVASGQAVCLSLCENVQPCVQVQVEPVSPDDWEIIQLNASLLENQMLNQTRAIWPGMVFPVWAHTMPAFLTVVSTEPAISSTQCLRLTSNTEVIVAPKERKKRSRDPIEVPPFELMLRVQPSFPCKNRTHSCYSESFPRQVLPHVCAINVNTVEVPHKVSACLLSQKRVLVWLSPKYPDPVKPREVNPILSVLEALPLTLTHDENLAPGHVSVHLSTLHLLHLRSFSRIIIRSFNHPRAKYLYETILPTPPSSIYFRYMGARTDKQQQRQLQNMQPQTIVSAVKEFITKQSTLSQPVPFVDGGVCSLPSSLFNESDGETESSLLFLKNGQAAPMSFQIAFQSQDQPEVRGSNADSSKIKRPSVTVLSPELLENTRIVAVLTEPDTTLYSSLCWPSLPDQWACRALEPCFKHLIGVDEQKKVLRRHLRTLTHPRQCRQLGVCPFQALLINGPKGTGKTFMATSVLHELSNNGLICQLALDCSTLVGKRPDIAKKTLRDLLCQAEERQPSVVFLDNLDKLLPAEEADGPSNPGADSIAELLIEMAGLFRLHGSSVALLCASLTHQSLAETFTQINFFDTTVALSPPNAALRKEIIEHQITTTCTQTQKNHAVQLLRGDIHLNTVAKGTEGFVMQDLRNLFDRAVHNASLRSIQGSTNFAGTEPWPVTLATEDFEMAKEKFTPVSLHGIHLHSSETSWSSVGAMNDVKQVLLETYQWPTQYASLFAQCPLRLRSGLLLYGPPGTGKSLIAGAVASECHLRFLSVKGPELLNKYIGASEQAVRDLFARARSATPCIVFFDEFDSLAPRRGHDTTGVTDRVVNQLLTHLDGVEKLDGVYVLAATSRPDLIDPALLRPGRLDKSLFCGLPSLDEREDILQTLASGCQLAKEVDLKEIAARCEHFSGADLRAVLTTAQLAAAHAQIDAKTEVAPPVSPAITQDQLLEAALSTRPSVGEKERNRFARIYANFQNSLSSTKGSAGDGPRASLA
eukprot:m.30719 g.30719  ORF g.30719 m.30719 type:complete len:1052 (-) comp14624_c0_seq1:49-3204(-)